MTITLTQTELAHNTNQLHDELIAAGLVPILVESTTEESRYTFADTVDERDVRKVFAKHIVKQEAHADLNQLWKKVREAKNFQELQAGLVVYEEAKHPERK